MSTKHVTKKVTLTVHEWAMLGKALTSAAAKSKSVTEERVLLNVADLASVVVDEAKA